MAGKKTNNVRAEALKRQKEASKKKTKDTERRRAGVTKQVKNAKKPK